MKNAFKSPALKREEIKGQDFNKDKIVITQAGKTFKVYDWIQEGREDTEIYPTLEKYGNLKPMQVDGRELHADFGELKNLRNLFEIDQKSTEMWNKLPLEIRNHFNNDRSLFVEQGEQWLNDLMAKKTEAKKEETKKEGVENNG